MGYDRGLLEADLIELTPVLTRLSKDVKAAAARMGPREARYLVDTYYQHQEQRKRAANQEKQAQDAGESTDTIGYVTDQAFALEKRVHALLQAYAMGHDVGRWSMSQVGIGPVISAGLLAHIDILKAPTVGHIWRFAGLDPTVRWEKGQKRPWNARLKTLCWHIGACIMRSHNHERSFYGPIYRKYKAIETARNESGELAEQAARQLAEKNYSRGTTTYDALTSGKLAKDQIDLRARRKTVKLFLSHWHSIAHETMLGTPAPRPYAFAHLEGHNDMISPPNWPMFE